MGTENNTTKEQLKFEDIKSELDAIVASLDEYNKNIPLDKLSDIVSLAKSYSIYDNIYKLYEVFNLHFLKVEKQIISCPENKHYSC